MSSGREKFKKANRLICILVKICSLIPKEILLKLLESFRMTQGKKGLLLRYLIIKNIAKECGDNVSIHPNVYILNPENLIIGSNVSIHPMCYLECFGGIDIGNDVSIAHSTSILSVNHTWKDEFVPIKYNEIESRRIIICDDVWIGCGARILAGVKINKRSVIAAGAVVNRNVYSNTVVAGIPAKEIKKI